ncbi:MAG: TlpA family protein disulfide reductase [Tannerella sp.]|jgi:peroxiredoxin|nr:TlpA family protein disulfide reductase [Tannerella sp.]
MKRNVSVLICLCAALAWQHAAAQEDGPAGDGVAVGDTVPAFTIVSDDGAPTPSAQFRGRVMLICFFATWCPTCQVELAEIEKTLWPEYRNREDFALLAVGREHSDAELKLYNAKKGFSFPLYPDRDRRIFDAFATQLIPRTYLTDRDGRIIYVATGYSRREFDNLMKAIDRALLR